MIASLSALPSHIRKRLVSALESGSIAAPYSGMSLRSVLGSQEGCEGIAGGLLELERLGISGPAAGAWIRTLDDAASRAPLPDLVWSGPEVPGLHARGTRQVFEELLSSAEQSVWASTYAFFDGPRAFHVLAGRMDARPEVHVRLLLNIQRRKGDTTAPDQLVRKFADRFWSTEWPGATRPTVFYDPRALELDGPAGVLHAKAVVVDEKAVFVTSANLTEAALDRNIELGLLCRDHALAVSVASYFRTLIERQVLVPLPVD